MTSLKRAQFLRHGLFSTMIGAVVLHSPPGEAATRTVHLQSFITLTCGGSDLCVGKFPRATSRRRFNVTRIACRLNGPNGSTLQSADVFLIEGGSFTFATFLSHVHSSPEGVHEVNDAADIRVSDGQQLQVLLELDSGVADSAFCSETGTTELLQ
jgi:hypothetical protein